MFILKRFVNSRPVKGGFADTGGGYVVVSRADGFIINHYYILSHLLDRLVTGISKTYDKIIKMQDIHID